MRRSSSGPPFLAALGQRVTSYGTSTDANLAMRSACLGNARRWREGDGWHRLMSGQADRCLLGRRSVLTVLAWSFGRREPALLDGAGSSNPRRILIGRRGEKQVSKGG